MRRTTIIIASDDQDLIEAFQAYLINQADLQIISTHTRKDSLLKTLNKTETDILLIDLFMHYCDGLKVVEEIFVKKYTYLRPQRIIVMTDFMSSFIASKLKEFHVDYILTHPIDWGKFYQLILGLNQLDDRIFKQYYYNNNPQIDEMISSILLKMGMPAKINGYNYLKEAISSSYHHSELLISISKTLYPAIAERFYTTVSRCERSIRHAIEVTWLRGDQNYLKEIFGFDCDFKVRPTNVDFISGIVDHLLCLK